jgi:hypothetical protein
VPAGSIRLTPTAIKAAIVIELGLDRGRMRSCSQPLRNV